MRNICISAYINSLANCLGKKLIKISIFKKKLYFGCFILDSRIYSEGKDEGHREMGFRDTWIYVKLTQKCLWHDDRHSRCSLPAININSLDFIYTDNVVLQRWIWALSLALKRSIFRRILKGLCYLGKK